MSKMNSQTSNVLQEIDPNTHRLSPKRNAKRIYTNEDDDSDIENRPLKKSKPWTLNTSVENEKDELADLGLGMLEEDEFAKNSNDNAVFGEFDKKILSDLNGATSNGTDEQLSITSPSHDGYLSDMFLTSEIINSSSKSSIDASPSILQQQISATPTNVSSKNIEDENSNLRQQIQEANDISDFVIVKRRPTSSAETPDYINLLPDEVILQILKWLPKETLTKCSLVSKRFCRLSRDEFLWTRLDLGCQTLYPGALGHVVERQVQILRLSQAHIEEPAFFSSSKVFSDDFRSKLQYLDLSMTVISCSTLSILFKSCKSLKKLSLEHVKLNEDVCQNLSENTNLEVLNFSMVSGLGLDSIKLLCTSLKSLSELNLAWTDINIEGLTYFCKNLPSSLTRLNLSGCRKTLKDTNVFDIAESAPNLRELDLSDCTMLTSHVIKAILSLKNLNFLAMSRCYAIRLSDFKSLKNISALSYFDIHGNLQDNGLKILRELLGDRITVNKFMFSSVARPTVGIRRSSIWGLRVRDV